MQRTGAPKTGDEAPHLQQAHGGMKDVDPDGATRARAGYCQDTRVKACRNCDWVSGMANRSGHCVPGPKSEGRGARFSTGVSHGTPRASLMVLRVLVPVIVKIHA